MEYFLMAFKRYADFEGRSSRAEYWYFVLWNFVFLIGLAFIGELLGTPVFTGIYYLVTIVPRIAVAVRRMHDTNHSGWFVLVPLYNLVCFVSEGDTGPNQYGPDPYATEEELEQYYQPATEAEVVDEAPETPTNEPNNETN